MRQLLLDVSRMEAAGSRLTGLQRVTANLARALSRSPPRGVCVRWVRREGSGYVGAGAESGRPLALLAGDVFLGLDLDFDMPLGREWFQAARRQGVAVVFVLHDLLPLRMPEAFEAATVRQFQEWFGAARELADGLLSVSSTVAGELRAELGIGARSLRIGWFHPGAAMVMPADAGGVEIAARLRGRPFALAVGTLEPRKAHRQLLAGFDQLWAAGTDLALVIAGGRGWKVDELIERIETHPAAGRDLFWLAEASDATLGGLYASATLLVAASLGEGFGLPLVEAAQHGLPVLARDLPVFREVTGGCACFFRGEDPEALAGAVAQWLQARGSRGAEAAAPWHGWEVSAQQVFSAVLESG